MVTNFAILAIGGINPMVKLCLDSIIHLQNVGLYVMTEKHNFSAFHSYEKENGIPIVLIDEPLLDGKLLNDPGEIKASYEIYGTDRFAQINILKWILIKKVLEQINYGDILFFSDFDVLWFRNPGDLLKEYKNTSILAQSEWKKVAGVNYCSGIIGIIKTMETKKIFVDLFLFHQEKLRFFEGRYFDQQAFNDFFSTAESKDKVAALPPDLFVIGAEIPRYLLKSQQKLYATHVNYLKGLNRKILAMQAISISLNKPKLRIIVATFVNFLLIEGRIVLAFEKLTKSIREITR
jgi:hypothetical protein